LINIHAKILKKIVVNQSQADLKRSVDDDNVEFIFGVQRWFNICKSINIIPHINKMMHSFELR
jgi:hypothetical protein